jgi:hypothetical protein
VAVDGGEAFGSGEKSKGLRVGMIETVGSNDDLLAGTTSPEENKEKKREEDWRVVAAAAISVDD